MSGLPITDFTRATLVAAAALAIAVVGAPPAAAVDAPSLVGAWVGPATIAVPGDCAPAAGLLSFSPNGVYRYLAMYPDCGMVMVDGHYELQNDGGQLQLSIDQCGDPGCPPGLEAMTRSISTTGPDTFVLDGQYTYQRQHD